MVGWHHQLSGHEFEQALGDGEGQGSLACCSPWGHRELDQILLLSSKELMLLNYGAGEDFRESLGLQGDPTNPS